MPQYEKSKIKTVKLKKSKSSQFSPKYQGQYMAYDKDNNYAIAPKKPQATAELRILQSLQEEFPNKQVQIKEILPTPKAGTYKVEAYITDKNDPYYMRTCLRTIEL
jgi:hypothetical protein